MDRALYFPHTTPRNKSLLKEALLLWDELEYIVPWRHFHPNTEDVEIVNVLNVIGRPHVPSEAAKERTHKRLTRLVEMGLPARYLFQPDQDSAPIYVEKLPRKTWHMLGEAKMLGRSFGVKRGNRWSYDYHLSPPLSLTIMTILAEECAGRTAVKMTDARYASDAQGAYLTRDLGGDVGKCDLDDETRVVTLPVPIIPLSDISLSRLTKLRETEDAFLRGLRRNYRKAVNAYIAEVTKPNTSADDLRRIAEGFVGRVHDRLEELDRMLDRRFKIADYNICEVMGHGFNAAMVTYAASTSSLAALLAGVGAIGIDGYFKLVGSIPLNDEKREELLTKNPAAWLYHVRDKAAAKRGR